MIQPGGTLYFSLNLEPLLLSVENTSKAGVVIIRSSGQRPPLPSLPSLPLNNNFYLKVWDPKVTLWALLWTCRTFY